MGATGIVRNALILRRKVDMGTYCIGFRNWVTKFNIRLKNRFDDCYLAKHSARKYSFVHDNYYDTAGIPDALILLKKVKSTSFDGSDVYCFVLIFDFCVVSLFEPLLLIFIISFNSLEPCIALTTDVDCCA
jgi:hypothetical protein